MSARRSKPLILMPWWWRRHCRSTSSPSSSKRCMSRGAVVVDNDRMVGVVTEMDLVFRNKRVHLPTFIAVFDAVIPFDPGGKAKAEFAKATGATVADVMTTDVVSATPDTSLSDIAAWMVERNLSMVPVLDGAQLVGVVTRRSMMLAAFRVPLR